MLKNHHLAKAIADVSWCKFNEYLRYKCDWYGKTYMQIGRFDASSKICNECGYTNHELTLVIREWECPQCKTVHDRDINAAINIKKFGYLRFLGTGTEVKQSPLEQSDISLEQ
jgi:putative transposase